MNSSEIKKILFLTTDPSNMPRLRTGQEVRDVEERLKLSTNGNSFSIEHHPSVRIGDFNFFIRNSKPYIVHFSGHGDSTGQLCLEDKDGKNCPLEIQLLTKIFKSASKTVRCVVLNACYSEEQAKVISDYVDYVVGMNQAIGDKAAIAFSVGFYGALGAGESIEDAYDCGCIDIESSGIKEYLTPVLYKNNKGKDETSGMDKEMNNGKIMLVCSGNFQEIDLPQVEAFLSHLQTFSKEELKITLKKMEPGSVKFFFDGTPEDIEKVLQLIKSGLLKDVSGLPIKQSVLMRDFEKVNKISTNTKSKQVPMMFRAQVNGRCQLQRLIRDEEPHALRWVNEWTQETYPQPPTFGSTVQTRRATLTWRFVTNSGQDDGVIRPVIGAKGYPFYPGSSMKGIFRQACTPAQADRYCGEDLARAGFKPGILRFHGGYPVDRQWTERLVDIVHPQQNWQVKTGEKSAAFVQISLYQPTLEFGISSTEDLAEAEWETVWEIWQRALSTGIGCRVSAGYGQPQKRTGEVLYRAQMKGRGQAAKLIDGTGEFRPNVFRAAIRGHALRLFGGLTDETIADRLVEELFGGVQGKGTVGLLSMGFRSTQLELGQFGKGSYAQTTYRVEGELSWLLTRSMPEAKEAGLRKLIAALTRFAMVLGGFGKSWRRADHRLFLEDYYDQENPLIGCHWEWLGERAWMNDVRVRKIEKVGEWITETRQIVQDWMVLQGVKPGGQAAWREAWHPDTVEVWGRMAANREDSLAIHWLHGAYREAIPMLEFGKGRSIKLL